MSSRRPLANKKKATRRKYRQHAKSEGACELHQFSLAPCTQQLHTIQSCAVSASRGLPQVQSKKPNIHHIVKTLESHVRAGDSDARVHLQDLIPVAAIGRDCDRALDLWLRPRPTVVFSVRSFPDIFSVVVQALCSPAPGQCELLDFVQCAFPNFSNTRRTKNDRDWACKDEDSLVILLQCCLPSLLSLYSQEGTKDVCFWLRVGIYAFFTDLFLGEHAARSDILRRLHALCSACFVEYVLYFSEHITPLPWLKTLTPAQEESLRANAANMGQQIRVELNQRYRAFLDQQPADRKCLGHDDVLALLLEVNPVSKTLYERVVRSHRMSYASRGAAVVKSAPRRTGKLRELDTARVFDERALELAPYTGNFCMFEKLCLRRGLGEDAIAALWVYTGVVRVHEGTAEMMHLQIARCREMGITSCAMLKRAASLSLCLRCIHSGNLSKFRSDLRTDSMSCCACNSADVCVQICLLGRIVYIHDIPIIMCPRCSRFVVYDGLGCVQPACDHGCCHRDWSKHVLTNTFQRQFARAGFMHTIGPRALVAQAWDVVSREYVQQVTTIMCLRAVVVLKSMSRC